MFKWKKVVPFTNDGDDNRESNLSYSIGAEAKPAKMLKSLFGHLPHGKKRRKKAANLLPLNVNGFNNDEFEETVNRVNPIFVDSDDPQSETNPLSRPTDEATLNELNSIEEFVQEDHLSNATSWLHDRGPGRVKPADVQATLNAMDSFANTEREVLRELDKAISESDNLSFPLGSEADESVRETNAPSNGTESGYDELMQVSEQISKPDVNDVGNSSENSESDEPSASLAHAVRNSETQKNLEKTENKFLQSRKLSATDGVEEGAIKKAMNVRAKAIEELMKKFQVPQSAHVEKGSLTNSTAYFTKDDKEIEETSQVLSSPLGQKRQPLEIPCSSSEDKSKKDSANEITSSAMPTKREDSAPHVKSGAEKSDQVPQQETTISRQDQTPPESQTVTNQTTMPYDTSQVPRGLFSRKSSFNGRSSNVEKAEVTNVTFNEEKPATLEKNFHNIEKQVGLHDFKLTNVASTLPQATTSSGSSIPAAVKETRQGQSLATANSNHVSLNGILSNKKENTTKSRAPSRPVTDKINRRKEENGVTRGDQSDQTQDDSQKPDVPAHNLKSNMADKRNSHKILHHTRSCHHRIKSLDDSSTTSHYEPVARNGIVQHPRWHRKRPESWAPDLSWNELVEREYLARHFHGLRFLPESIDPSLLHQFPGHFRKSKIYREPFPWQHPYSQESPGHGAFANEDINLRPSVVAQPHENHYESFRTGLSACAGEDCVVRKWRRGFLRSHSLRYTGCTCGLDHNGPYADNKKVKFADSAAAAQTELPRTEELPETESQSEEGTSPDDNDTASDEAIAQAKRDEVERRNEQKQKKSKEGEDAKNKAIKSVLQDEKSTFLHPWEMEHWNFLARQRLLRQRRRRALFMGGMALVLVVFVGLSVGMVMVYLRRKSL